MGHHWTWYAIHVLENAIVFVAIFLTLLIICWCSVLMEMSKSHVFVYGIPIVVYHFQDDAYLKWTFMNLYQWSDIGLQSRVRVSAEMDLLTLHYPQLLSPLPSDRPSQSGLRLSLLDPVWDFILQLHSLFWVSAILLTKLQTWTKYFHNIH